MSMLPEAKLDVLLAHHASLEAELLGQINSESYVRITRELAELNPLIEAVKAHERRLKAWRSQASAIAEQLPLPGLQENRKKLIDRTAEAKERLIQRLASEGEPLVRVVAVMVP